MKDKEITHGLRVLMARWDVVQANVVATLPHLSETAQAAIVSALMTLWIEETPNRPN